MTSWEPVDLATILDGNIETEQPSRLRISTGQALLYPNRLHSLTGEPSGGKSWLAAYTVAEALTDHRIVVVIDLEDSARLWVDRLRRLGVDDKSICIGLRYIHPTERFNDEAENALAPILEEVPAVIVIDAMQGVLALHGLDPNSAADVEAIYRRLLRPLRASGACLLVLDHTTKSKETRGRWAAGSERKLSALDGAGYVLETISPFGRGRRGLAKLTLSKDRVGTIGSVGDVVAEMRMTDTDTGGIRVELTPPETTSGPFRPTVLMSRVSDVLKAAGEPLSTSKLESRVVGKSAGIRAALTALEAEGYTTTTNGPRGSTLHHLIAEFVDEESSQAMSPRPRPHLVPTSSRDEVISP